MIDDIRPRIRPQIHDQPTEQPEPSAPEPISPPEPTIAPTPEGKFGPVFGANQSTDRKPKLLRLLPAMTLSRLKRLRHNRKELTIVIVIGVALLLLVGLTSYLALKHLESKSVSVSSKVLHPKLEFPPKPITVASTLTGLIVDPSINNRPVTAVMIENSLDARPQSGLDQAGVVFEAVAEGGVTRFLALFQDSQPDYIGPIRSARPYYIQWMLGFDAAYAHVGGSPDALQDIGSWGVKDLNQFYNAAVYDRISSRYAPHNVYTSLARLNQLEASKGFGKSNYTGFVRKAETPDKTPNATSINMTFSGPYYDPHYDYDPTTNTYKRSEYGAPHMELHSDGSKVQIAPKVVIAMIVPESSGALDSSGAYYSNYTVIGNGQVFVFQDGTVQTGTWSKASNTSQINFIGADGHPIKLNPGQTWIGALKSNADLTYH